MKKTDIGIKIILALLMLPNSAFYLWGIEKATEFSLKHNEIVLYSLVFPIPFLAILTYGYALFSIWWLITRCHSLTLKQLPRYIEKGLIIGGTIFTICLLVLILGTNTFDVWKGYLFLNVPPFVAVVIIFIVMALNKHGTEEQAMTFSSRGYTYK